MAKTLRIRLNTDIYREPTEQEIREAKDYVLRMSEYADVLGDKVLDVLRDAARTIALICLKYNIPAKDFEIAANKDMQDEVYAVMDDVEDEIFDLMQDYSTRCDDNEERRKLLLLWLLSLGWGNKNLRDTLHDKLRQFLYDLEAQIAAMKLAGYTADKAVERILETLTGVYKGREVQQAIMRPIRMAAFYIQERGVHHGNRGQSSSGANNVISMVKTTLTMAWQYMRGLIFKARGAIGYYQLRGSTYNCDPCDSEVGFHKGLEGITEKPMVHPNCMCYRIPVYNK